MFAKCFARIILQYVPEGSGSWKYNHYFPVAKGEGKITQSPLGLGLVPNDRLSFSVPSM